MNTSFIWGFVKWLKLIWGKMRFDYLVFLSLPPFSRAARRFTSSAMAMACRWGRPE
jgi:hypothetical protein